jgi:hypothetical protein
MIENHAVRELIRESRTKDCTPAAKKAALPFSFA